LDRRSLNRKKSRGLVNIDQRTIVEGVKIPRSGPGVRQLSRTRLVQQGPHMPNSHTLPTDPPLGVLERPRCKHCQAKMNMAGIAPGLAGYELCTFECSNCRSVQRTLVVTDPLNGEARKWLKGQLKSPN